MNNAIGVLSLATIGGLLAASGCLQPQPPDDVQSETTLDAVDSTAIDSTTADTLPADVPMGPAWCTVGTNVAQAVVPSGYCLRLFAGSADTTAAHSPVVEPRVMAFAPNGDLFVSAPSTAAAGGAQGGPGAILVLSDDDGNGIAEVHTFLSGVPDVHGIAIAADAIYYTAANSVFRTAYSPGQRAATGSPQTVSAIPNPGRWTHGLARSQAGAMYVSNGVLGATCPDPNVGYVATVHPGIAPTMTAVGLRNPMFMRCHFRDDICFAAEMGDDSGASWGAHEKMFRIHDGTDYGFPCCAGPNMPAPGATSCSSVTMEDVTIPLGASPFGFDWEHGLWPAPLTGALCLAQHGSFYTSPPWQGEGVYCIPTDPVTHLPNGAFSMFVGGFSPANVSVARMQRPADVMFGPDGRMFIADDFADAIYWVAPESLRMPAH